MQVPAKSTHRQSIAVPEAANELGDIVFKLRETEAHGITGIEQDENIVPIVSRRACLPVLVSGEAAYLLFHPSSNTRTSLASRPDIYWPPLSSTVKRSTTRSELAWKGVGASAPRKLQLSKQIEKP